MSTIESGRGINTSPESVKEKLFYMQPIEAVRFIKSLPASDGYKVVVSEEREPLAYTILDSKGNKLANYLSQTLIENLDEPWKSMNQEIKKKCMELHKQYTIPIDEEYRRRFNEETRAQSQTKQKWFGFAKRKIQERPGYSDEVKDFYENLFKADDSRTLMRVEFILSHKIIASCINKEEVSEDFRTEASNALLKVEMHLGMLADRFLPKKGGGSPQVPPSSSGNPYR